MKKTILLLIILIALLTGFASAQIKTDKYCQVIVARKRAKISFGADRDLFKLKDTSAMQQLNFVNYLTTEADVLNYMSKLGWSLVNVHSAGPYTLEEFFYFKKAFNASELAE